MGDGRILGGRVGYELKRAQHALRLEMDGALKEVGLTTPQYAALSVVEGEGGLSGALLARRCFVAPQTTNGILVNLEKAGHLERRAHPEHGRVLQAYLTGDGERMLSRCPRARGGHRGAHARRAHGRRAGAAPDRAPRLRRRAGAR